MYIICIAADKRRLVILWYAYGIMFVVPLTKLSDENKRYHLSVKCRHPRRQLCIQLSMVATFWMHCLRGVIGLSLAYSCLMCRFATIGRKALLPVAGLIFPRFVLH